MVKHSEIILFLPAYSLIIYVMRSPKNFEKNSHFENMTPGFLHRWQNSLRQNCPEICNAFSGMTKIVFYQYGYVIAIILTKCRLYGI